MDEELLEGVATRWVRDLCVEDDLCGFVGGVVRAEVGAAYAVCVA